MLKYPCLVLDHDDTVVASEASVNYPCFLVMLDHFRPGAPKMDLDSFTRWCFDPGFSELLRQNYNFTHRELEEEFQMWLDYASQRIPPAYPGIREVILEQKKRGGLVCVVSHSGRSNILRDYEAHFGIQPDMIFSWEDPPECRKPNPYPLEQIMQIHHLSPGELLMVDDLKPGRDMAAAVGVDMVYAGWSRSNAPELGELMRSWCDYSFDSPWGLYDFLFGGTV